MEIKTDKRPWGSFRQFTENEPSTIKIIDVDDGHKLSLQYHHSRDEFWVVLTGTPKVTIGEKNISAAKGDEFFIARKTVHRVEAVGGAARILEIAFGDFDENDIVRLEDAYGRIH